MTDLDLRLVRYFTVVAAELHFGRAASMLRIAQPSLSRQIGRLEAQLGVRLLDRNHQGTRLTEAGATFLPHALALLLSADRAAAAAASGGARSYTIGHTVGLLVSASVRILQHRYPEVAFYTRHLRWDQPRAALLDRRVDAVVTRLPLSDDGLTITVLRDEDKVLLVARHHPLAARTHVELDDFATESIPRLSDPEFDAYWRIDPRPDGRPAPDGPRVDSIEDKVEQIASGHAVAIAPAAFSALGLRTDLVAVPTLGLEPGRIVIATRRGEEDRLSRAVRSACNDAFSGEAPSPGHEQASGFHASSTTRPALEHVQSVN